MSALLQVRGLCKSFGGLAAVKNLDFDVRQGEIVGLIGPNGAGKSTAFNLISGTLTPDRGRVIFDGADITRKKPSKVVQQGLARTFQSASIYTGTTVFENVFRGAISRLSTPLWAQLAASRAYRQAMRQMEKEILDILDITGLAEYKDIQADTLAYGHQKRLGVAIGLATRPRLLLLDEPAAGLNAEECADFARLLKTLRTDHGLTLLFVEHHMALVMDTCERIVVLVQGEKIATGSPEEIRNDAAVIDAYLGVPEHAFA